MNINLFLLIIAWPVAIFYTIVIALKLWSSFTYEGSLQQKLDRIKGIRRSWPIGFPIIIALVAWALIVSLR